jgi:hypothetical protein
MIVILKACATCKPTRLTASFVLLHGEFRSFTLLFVTIGDARVDNVRREMHNLPAELAGYYRFTAFDRAMDDFLGPIWKSRSLSDTQCYPLVREAAVNTGVSSCGS